jgi:hypothetical protein
MAAHERRIRPSPESVLLWPLSSEPERRREVPSVLELGLVGSDIVLR